MFHSFMRCVARRQEGRTTKAAASAEQMRVKKRKRKKKKKKRQARQGNKMDDVLSEGPDKRLWQRLRLRREGKRSNLAAERSSPRFPDGKRRAREQGQEEVQAASK